MKIDLNPLINGVTNKITIEETVTFGEDEFKNTSILKTDKVKVSGAIDKIGDDTFHLFLNIKTILFLEDSVTLEPISYPLNVSLEKNIGAEEEEEYYKIFENTLDILPIIWENIVLEVPLRIVKEERDTVIEGNGWSLNKVEETNPLSELKDLLDMEEKR